MIVASTDYFRVLPPFIAKGQSFVHIILKNSVHIQLPYKNANSRKLD